MIYKLITTVFILLLVIFVSVYFFAPKYLNLNDSFYDRFYSGVQLQSRVDEREIVKFPKTVERLALSGPTDRGVGIRVADECDLLDGRICTRDYKLEYMDYKGDYYTVTIKKFRSQTDFVSSYDQIRSLSTGIEGNFYRFERHELGWFSERENSFILIQKGVCTTVNNQPGTCNYPNKLMVDDVFVSKYVSVYPQN